MDLNNHELDEFAPEHDLIVPPRHATQAPLARDIPFVYDWAPVSLDSAPQPRGRSGLLLTLLFLTMVVAAIGAYLYYPNRPFDLDTIAAWASSLARPPNTAPVNTGPVDTATTTPSAAATGTQPDDPAPADRLPPSTESSAASSPNPKADPAQSQSPAPLATQADTIHNVSGEWRVDTQIEATDSSFQPLELHYEMTLKQDGNRVAGVGTKIGENARTPVTMTGTIAGDRLTLNVVEGVGSPEMQTKFVLLIDEPGTLRGRFSSSATPSSGHVEARRGGR